MPFIIDHETGSFETKEHSKYGRCDFGISRIKHKIYTFGGEHSKKTYEAYNMLNNKWKKIGKLPQPSNFVTSVEMLGKIYISGGLMRNVY